MKRKLNIRQPALKADYILVVAKSARLLTQAARKAGKTPLAIDLYGDCDTQAFAEAYHKVTSLESAYLQPAVEYYCRRYPVKAAVYGSGFEPHNKSIELLQDYFVLYGNSPEVFDAVNDKRLFFAVLDYLSIPYPKISFSRPADFHGWLVKPAQGQGGIGIKKYCKDELTGFDVYWQKHQKGEAHSVLFLADGERSQIVGFNRQWAVALNENAEFMFSGIMNHTRLTKRQKFQLACWVDKLVAALSLNGLNSLDFIQNGEASYVLEINPRPPASMQLYDADLFGGHVKACQGELADYQPVKAGITGYQVIYAPQNLTIPCGFNWPEDVMDIPDADTVISAGQPICSMITYAQTPQAVHEQLLTQQNFIINALNRFQVHGI